MDFFPLIIAVVGIIILINFKQFTASVLKNQQHLWYRGKPPTKLVEKATQLLILLVCLALTGFGLYDGLKGLWQT